MPDSNDSRPLIEPASPDSLHAFVADQLGLRLARQPRGTSPFDFLCHSFFEGRDEHGAISLSPDCVVWAARGSGKTLLAAVATALDLLFKPGVEVRLLGGSLEQSARMYGHLRALFDRPALHARLRGRVTARRLMLDNGSAAELLAQSPSSVRGTRVHKLRCDEVELFKPEIFEAAQLTTRSERLGGRLVRGSVECFSTMHVPHGLMARIVRDASASGRRVFRWGVVDVLALCGEEHRCRNAPNEPQNADGECPLWLECGGRAKEPAASGHVEVADALAMKARVSRQTWEAEMLCQRPSRGDSVYAEFDRAAHVVDAEPEAALWIVGMDFGFRSPTAILWALVTADGRVVVVDERVIAERVLDDHIAAIAASRWPKPSWIGVDPAGQQRNEQTGVSCAGAIRGAGYVVRARSSAIHEGIELVRARLRPADGSPPRLVLHRRCEKLIEALESYHYDSSRPESDTPVKDGPDHAADALRYMILNLDRPGRTDERLYS
ncbi:MAG: hypothetical protein ACKVW3_16035 [Phycisphaerales bacterium]